MIHSYRKLWIFIALCRFVGSSSGSPVRKAPSPILLNRFETEQRSCLPPVVAANLLIRGGNIEEDVCSSSDNIILNKVRNLVRSLLEITDRKSPGMKKVFKGVLGNIEKLIGVRLLPKRNDKKKKKTKAPSPEKSDDLEAEKSITTKKKKPKVSSKVTATTKKHVSATIASSNPNYRIQRELKEFLKSPPPNLSVKVGSNIRIWIVTMVGANNTIYEDEVFKLRIQFPKDYPTVPPSVYFLQPAPQHEHVYTNGDICLSLLGKDWRPTMTAQSIAVSILSILSSAQSKSLPMDNARHSPNKPGQYQKDW
eukprot:CAMPEP_0178919592 /NCGR_PEP_ID=MMETSP0786-20121207/14523_1 /TAXON_ID=186022 /ORGANISM="Thalassionema frauenfeldii, Strain CCMP 1798" /LENGTH=308 /DNA_ID=CAMNT_0020593541 /DNA_START=83 /DNA_END=1006 /DNA_ORIENTATION=+